MSIALRDANRALLAAVNDAIGGDSGRAAAFKDAAAGYAAGRLTPDAYLSVVLDAGLAHLLPDMVALLPAGARRDELTGAAAAAGLLDEGAAAAALATAAAAAAWPCSGCTLLNAPSALRCEACGRKAPPRVKAGSGGGGSSAPPPPQRGGRRPKFERVRLNSGNADATRAFLESTGAVAVRPGNVWTHRGGGAETLRRQGE